MKKIAIIGAGNMGGAIALGLVAQKICAADEIVCAVKSDSSRKRLAETIPGICLAKNNTEAVLASETIILALKPWLVDSVLEEIRDVLTTGARRLISVAAGVSLAQLRERVGSSTLPVFVAIPNTAIAVAQSMTFIATECSDQQQTNEIVDLFSKLGKTMLVPEKQLSAGTAIASCGIAFAMRYVRASTEGGIELGLRPDVARDAVLQTLKGAAELLGASGENPESAIDKVTTPGGITIRGLNKMEESGFSAAVIQGLRACR